MNTTSVKEKECEQRVKAPEFCWMRLMCFGHRRMLYRATLENEVLDPQMDFLIQVPATAPPAVASSGSLLAVGGSAEREGSAEAELSAEGVLRAHGLSFLRP